MEDDLIRDILARVMALSEDFTQDQALTIEKQIRHDWGGERVVVAKVRDNPKGSRYGPHIKQAIVDEVERGSKPEEVHRKYGVGRATIYRLLRRS